MPQTRKKVDARPHHEEQPKPTGSDPVEPGAGEQAAREAEESNDETSVSGDSDDAPDAPDESRESREEPGEVETRYSVIALREGSRQYFGCSPLVVAGALSAERERQYTIAEAKALVSDFLEVEHGDESA